MMKQNMRYILNLMTLFNTIIAACAAILVCFIVVYPHIKGNFSRKESKDTSQGALIVQSYNGTYGDIYNDTHNDIYDNAYNSTYDIAYDDRSEAGATSDESNLKLDKQTFSGDVREFIGLKGMDAYKLLGDGAEVVDLNRYILNDKNGMDVFLSNTLENISLFTVNEVCLKLDAGVFFDGIKVGDTLKDADKILMAGGALYTGGLKWETVIDSKLYKVSLTTTDNKTIETLSVGSIPKGLELYGAEAIEDDYTYTEDWHDLELIYWE